jgi:hypothetical protein
LGIWDFLVDNGRGKGGRVMKTRANYPFIYFFVEPNVVFVYKIEVVNYVTVADVSQYGEWGTYEVKNADLFETFDHESYVPLVGQGYFVQQDQLHSMIEKINQLIHKQRNFLQEVGAIETTTFHLVSSSSTAGALRVGLDRPKTVIEFQDSFAMGPIWKLDSKIGQAYRYEWSYENINFEQDDLESRFSHTLLEIADIPKYAPIYIWTANNGNEQTGVRFIVYQLRAQANEIFLINTTEHYHQWGTPSDERQSMFHSSMLQPHQLKLLFEQSQAAKPLSQQERIHFQQEWEALAQKKDVLRLWQNGRIASVPEDYYDSLIIETMKEMHLKQESKEFIRAGRVIGEILSQMNEVVGDAYLEYRLRHLIYNGILELKGIPKSMRHYSVKLRG